MSVRREGHFPLGISSCQAFNEWSLVPFPPRAWDTGDQTARTWCLCAHLMLARTFVWASTQCGSIAEFCSCFPFIPAQTLELSSTTARSCLCCGSIIKIYPGAKLCWISLYISNYSNFKCFAQRLMACRSRIVFKRWPNNQVFYVLPVEFILGKLPVVPVGETRTIPYCMHKHAADTVGAAFHTREGAGDGSRWWYINTWALSWSRERSEKWWSLVSRPAYFKTII